MCFLDAPLDAQLEASHPRAKHSHALIHVIPSPREHWLNPFRGLLQCLSARRLCPGSAVRPTNPPGQANVQERASRRKPDLRAKVKATSSSSKSPSLGQHGLHWNSPGADPISQGVWEGSSRSSEQDSKERGGEETTGG